MRQDEKRGEGRTRLIANRWDDATIAERYSGEVGEEYKERLSAKVEGKEYTPQSKNTTATATPNISLAPGSRSHTPLSTRSVDSPARSATPSAPGGKVKVDDKYFANLGAANASRSADVPPSQGGKYSGFGSAPPEPVRNEGKLLGLDDLQKDPVAALSKGFGWFTSTVGRTAKTVNEGYIQPTAQKVQSLFLLIYLVSLMSPQKTLVEVQQLISSLYR